VDQGEQGVFTTQGYSHSYMTKPMGLYAKPVFMSRLKFQITTFYVDYRMWLVTKQNRPFSGRQLFLGWGKNILVESLFHHIRDRGFLQL